MITEYISPRCNHTGWLGVKHQVTYHPQLLQHPGLNGTKLACVTEPLTHRTNKTNTVTLTKVSPIRGSLAFLFHISFLLTAILDTIANIQCRVKMDSTLKSLNETLKECWAWANYPGWYSLIYTLFLYFCDYLTITVPGTYSIQRHQFLWKLLTNSIWKETISLKFLYRIERSTFLWLREAG